VRQPPLNNTPCKNNKNRDLTVYKRWNNVEKDVKKLFESSSYESNVHWSVALTFEQQEFLVSKVIYCPRRVLAQRPKPEEAP